MTASTTRSASQPSKTSPTTGSSPIQHRRPAGDREYNLNHPSCSRQGYAPLTKAETLHLGITREQVSESTSFELLWAKGLEEGHPPSAEELHVLREEVDPHRYTSGIGPVRSRALQRSHPRLGGNAPDDPGPGAESG